MPRGGRPSLSPDDLRRERRIYLSDREMNAVTLRAAESGQRVPDFMRSALLSGTIVAAPTISADQWSRLAPLASNINQIAARLNSNPNLATRDDIVALATLSDLLREVRLHLLSVEPSS